MILEVSLSSKSGKLISNVSILLRSADATPWFLDISTKPWPFPAQIGALGPQRRPWETGKGPNRPRARLRSRFFELRRSASTPGQQDQSPCIADISATAHFSREFVFQDRLVTLDKLIGQKIPKNLSYSDRLTPEYGQILNPSEKEIHIFITSGNSRGFFTIYICKQYRFSCLYNRIDRRSPEFKIWIRKSTSLINFDKIPLFRRRFSIRNFHFHNSFLRNGIHWNNLSILKFVWRLCCYGLPLAFCSSLPDVFLVLAVTVLGTINYVSKMWKHISSPSTWDRLSISSVECSQLMQKYIFSLQPIARLCIRSAECSHTLCWTWRPASYPPLLFKCFKMSFWKYGHVPRLG